MRLFTEMNLRTRAVVATGGILLLALVLNTALSMYTTAGKYREAVMGRTTALAEGIKKDIDKVLGFGLSLDGLEGMSENLDALKQIDRDIALVSILDRDGKVLYATDRGLEKTRPTDGATKKALGAEEPLVQEYTTAGQDLIEKVFPLAEADG